MREVGIFVPARLSSQRLPNKQILPIGETCMFEICCKKLDYIKKYYGISTYVLICDDELIAIAEKYPNVKIVIRDVATAEAEGPLQFIFKDILDVTEKYLMFLNPCLIFLSPQTIVTSICNFLVSGKEYGTSTKTFQNWLWDDYIKPVTSIDYQRLTTKEINPWMQAAHCFHIFNREMFKEDGYMLKEDIALLEIPIEQTIDIDTKEDYEYAKFKYETSEVYF